MMILQYQISQGVASGTTTDFGSPLRSTKFVNSPYIHTYINKNSSLKELHRPKLNLVHRCTAAELIHVKSCCYLIPLFDRNKYFNILQTKY